MVSIGVYLLLLLGECPPGWMCHKPTQTGAFVVESRYMQDSRMIKDAEEMGALVLYIGCYNLAGFDEEVMSCRESDGLTKCDHPGWLTYTGVRRSRKEIKELKQKGGTWKKQKFYTRSELADKIRKANRALKDVSDAVAIEFALLEDPLIFYKILPELKPTKVEEMQSWSEEREHELLKRGMEKGKITKSQVADILRRKNPHLQNLSDKEIVQRIIFKKPTKEERKEGKDKK